MSAKKWIKGSGGMYTKTPVRGARAGKICYWARVWIKSRKEFAHFFLGLTPKQADRRMHKILGDPEAALVERQRQQLVVPTFGEALDGFLREYRSRGETNYYHDITKAPREFFGDRPLTEVTSVALDDYVKRRRSVTRKGDGGRKVSESSIRKELIALGTFFKWAKRKGYVHNNPADAESMPRPKDTFDPGDRKSVV